MKRALALLCLTLAFPLAAQPSRYSLARQIRPGFGTTLASEATTNLLGDTYCFDGTNFVRIAGNTTAVRWFSISLGTGSVSACPVWGILASGDIPANAANTSGSAAKWTTARNLAGNSVDGSGSVAFANKFIVQGTADTGLSGPQFLGALGTGVVKNTTTTGVLSIAAAADVPSLLTTKGDLLTYSTLPLRLGIGTDTWVLTVDSTAASGLKWAAIPTLNQNTTGSAATLTTARAINGVNFNGSAAITVTADASTLSGTTVKSTVVNSSLTSVGTLTSGATGAGFTLALTTSTVTGTLADAQLSANVPLLNAANSFSLINPMTTIAESWIGPSSTTGVYFKGGQVGIGMTPAELYTMMQVAGPVKSKGSNTSLRFGQTEAADLFTISTNNNGSDVQDDVTKGSWGIRLSPASDYFSVAHKAAGASGTLLNSFYIDTNSNVGIKTIAFGTSAAGVLGIANGTAPTSSPAGIVQLWSAVVSSVQELRVRDGAGNITTLSPHNFSMFTPDVTQVFPWSYYSKNAVIGKEMSVDMYGAIAALEKLTGKQFIYLNDLPADQIEDWDVQEATNKTTVEKQRLDKAMEKEVEVVDAIESVPIMETRPSETLTESVTTYALDAASGVVKPVVVTKPKTEQVDTGKTEFRLKAGVRLDEKTGVFWRHVHADEVPVEPYVPKEPPAWMKDRMKVAVR